MSVSNRRTRDPSERNRTPEATSRSPGTKPGDRINIPSPTGPPSSTETRATVPSDAFHFQTHDFPSAVKIARTGTTNPASAAGAADPSSRNRTNTLHVIPGKMLESSGGLKTKLTKNVLEAVLARVEKDSSVRSKNCPGIAANSALPSRSGRTCSTVALRGTRLIADSGIWTSTLSVLTSWSSTTNSRAWTLWKFRTNR